MSIKLTFVTKDGIQKDVQLEKNTERIILTGNEIASINLTPLRSCVSLQQLDLGENQLRSISLAPLKVCRNLKHLNLQNNQIHRINITPLSSCANLFRLDMNRNEIRNIDLGPLHSCTMLDYLSLENNKLSGIDLAPLSSCIELRGISLGGNRIQKIDLAPLNTCTNLRTLSLVGNQLRDIDLSALRHCSRLQNLHLNQNQIVEIDLTPLNSCTQLKGLTLMENQLQRIDITPFHFHGELAIRTDGIKTSWLSDYTSYARPMRSDSWSWTFLHYVVEQYGANHRVQQDVLYSLNLDYLGFIDSDLQQVLLKYPSGTAVDEVRHRLLRALMEKVVNQIDENGPTIGLDLENTMKHGEIAIRVETILKKRREEMECLVLHIGRHPDIDKPTAVIDLVPLCFTHYGFQILTSLKDNLADRNGLLTDRKSFQCIKEHLDTLDFNIEIEDQFPNATLPTLESRIESTRTDLTKNLRETLCFYAMQA